MGILLACSCRTSGCVLRYAPVPVRSLGWGIFAARQILIVDALSGPLASQLFLIAVLAIRFRLALSFGLAEAGRNSVALILFLAASRQGEREDHKGNIDKTFHSTSS